MSACGLKLTSDDLAKAIVDNSPNMIVVTDIEGRYVWINPTAEKILGITTALAEGLHVGELLGEDLGKPIQKADGRVLESEEVLRFDEHYWVDDHLHVFETTKFPVYEEDGSLVGICSVAVDITARRAAEQQVLHNSNYDRLTELPNRFLFVDRLQHAIIASGRDSGAIAVLYIDLDNFGGVNDAFGAMVGDQLLVEAAWRLTSCVRSADTVARLSGDEFAIIVSGLDHAEDAERIAGKIRAALAPPTLIDDQELFVSASIGIAAYPDDAATADDLLRNAAIAMHRAKRRGRAGIQRFSNELSEAMTRNQRIESLLKRAIERDEFRVVYQPLVGANCHTVVAAEALLRWESPVMGSVGPQHFIPVAEETGLIIDIGWYVLRQACRDAYHWNALRDRKIAVSVNVAPRQLLADDFVETVLRILNESGLPPALLKLEMTESGLLENIERCRATFNTLRAMGIQISLDDFGTGYSALGYLQTFQFDVLKLDRSFIRDIVDGSEHVQVAESIIHMAKRLGLKLVAEGVENSAQLAFLRENGCEIIQGFYFSRPRSFEDFADYIAESQASIAA